EELFNFSNLDDPTRAAAKLDSKNEAPYVNLKGQTAVESVQIYVEAKGFAVDKGIKLSVRSSPPMEESQVVAMLVTGRQQVGELSGKEVPGLLTSSVANQVTSAL